MLSQMDWETISVQASKIEAIDDEQWNLVRALQVAHILELQALV
jgi:hypothetical protein